MEIWKDAWRSIFRRPARSGLTILSISIGIFAVMLIGAIGEMGKEAVSAELTSLGMQSITIRAGDESATELTRTELDMLKQEKGIVSVTPLVVEYSDITVAQQPSEKAVIWGVDANIDTMISMEILYGRGIEKEDIQRAAEVCVVEEGLARQLYGRENAVGRRLLVNLGGQERRLEIVGIAAAGGNLFQSMMGNTVPLFVYLPYTTHQIYTGKEGFDRIAVQLANETDSAQIGEDLRVELNQWFGEDGAVAIDNLSQYTATFTHLMDLVTAILSAIAGISLIVAGLSVMTAMLSSVGERTREIGIKKSMGAPSATIVAEFLLEAAFLSVAGSAAGILVGIAVGWCGSLLTGLPYQLPVQLMGICILSALLTGLLFGAYPARRASMLRPVEALR